MEREYHISLDSKNLGVFTLTQLKQHKVDPNALVWYDGIDNWKPVAEVEELKSYIKATPPPLPKSNKKKVIYGKGYFIFGLFCIITGGTLSYFGLVDKAFAASALITSLFSIVFRIIVTAEIVRTAKEYKRSSGLWGVFAFLLPSTACLCFAFVKPLKKRKPLTDSKW